MDIASEGIRRVFNHLFVKWAEVDFTVNVLHTQIGINVVTWFSLCNQPFQALRDYHLTTSGRDALAAFAFMYVSLRVGGLLAAQDEARMEATALAQKMRRTFKAQHAPIVQALTTVMNTKSREVMRTIRALTPDDDEPIGCHSIGEPTPEHEKKLEADWASTVHAAVMVMVAQQDESIVNNAIDSLLEFAANPTAARHTPGDDDKEEDAADESVALAIASAESRAMGAEQIAEAAERQSAEATKLVSSLAKMVKAAEKRAAKAEGRVAQMEAKMAQMEAKMTQMQADMQADKQADMQADMQTLRDGVTDMIAQLAQQDAAAEERLCSVESSVATLDGTMDVIKSKMRDLDDADARTVMHLVSLSARIGDGPQEPQDLTRIVEGLHWVTAKVRAMLSEADHSRTWIQMQAELLQKFQKYRFGA